MLILRRKINQSIWIAGPNGGSWVHILAIDGRNRVKIGVTAPEGVEVLRGELAGEDPVRSRLREREREDRSNEKP